MLPQESQQDHLQKEPKHDSAPSNKVPKGPRGAARSLEVRPSKLTSGVLNRFLIDCRKKIKQINRSFKTNMELNFENSNCQRNHGKAV